MKLTVTVAFALIGGGGAVVIGRGQVLLVARPHVLEPDLGHPLGQSRQVGNALEILSVGIGIEQEIGLQNVQLLLGERRSYPFRFAATATFRVRFCSIQYNSLIFIDFFPIN